MSHGRAWTLGFPPAYEKAVRIPGNGKAPGGYAFRTREEALAHVEAYPKEAGRYAPYEVELPGPWEDITTDDYEIAAAARHRWHTHSDDPTDPAVPFMKECGVCVPRPTRLRSRLFTEVAPFINPDVDRVVPAEEVVEPTA